MKARLDHPTIESLKPAEKMYKVWDTDTRGFFLRVLPSGRKTFALFYRHDGKGRDYTLGAYGQVSPEEACQQARACLASVAQGVDIIQRKTRDVDSKPLMPGPKTLGELIETSAGLEPKSSFGSDMQTLLELPIEALRLGHIEAYQDTALANGLQASTINRRVSKLKKWIAEAQSAGYLTHNPLVGLTRLKERPSETIRFLSSEEEKQLRHALENRQSLQRADRAAFNTYLSTRGCRPLADLDGPFTDHLKPMVLIALNTGLRRAELFTLCWEHVRPRERELLVLDGKQKQRTVPLNDEAFDTLRMWRNQHQPPVQNRGLVFPSPKTGGQLISIGSAWTTLVSMTDLTPLKFGDLRHTYIVNQLRAGIDLQSVAKTLGQSNLKTLVRYLGL